MNTKEFLSGLDYTQLRFAKQQIDSLIQAKEREEKVALFVLCDEDLNYAAFREDQYDGGVESLCREIKAFSRRFPGADLHFSLQKNWYRSSEVEDMLKL